MFISIVSKFASSSFTILYIRMFYYTLAKELLLKWTIGIMKSSCCMFRWLVIYFIFPSSTQYRLFVKLKLWFYSYKLRFSFNVYKIC